MKIVSKMKKAVIFLPLLFSTGVSAQERFLGEIIFTAATFCPRGSAQADGQLMPISSYSALFSILGTQYGGDGSTTFALPDLRGATPVGAGTNPRSSQKFVNGQYRQGHGCPTGQSCDTGGTSNLTLLPCITIEGIYPGRG